MTYYWETVWKDFHKRGAPDLFPEDLREEIIALNEEIYYNVNNGVYKAGFAETQEAYTDACEKVFNRICCDRGNVFRLVPKGPDNSERGLPWYLLPPWRK
jgi:glutathionyl-hydroquinone reductase